MLLARTRFLVEIEISPRSSSTTGGGLDLIFTETRRQRLSLLQYLIMRRRLSAMGRRQSCAGHTSGARVSSTQSAAASGLAFLFRYGATLSYLGLLSVFTIKVRVRVRVGARVRVRVGVGVRVRVRIRVRVRVRVRVTARPFRTSACEMVFTIKELKRP